MDTSSSTLQPAYTENQPEQPFLPVPTGQHLPLETTVDTGASGTCLKTSNSHNNTGEEEHPESEPNEPAADKDIIVASTKETVSSEDTVFNRGILTGSDGPTTDKSRTYADGACSISLSTGTTGANNSGETGKYVLATSYRDTEQRSADIASQIEELGQPEDTQLKLVSQNKNLKSDEPSLEPETDLTMIQISSEALHQELSINAVNTAIIDEEVIEISSPKKSAPTEDEGDKTEPLEARLPLLDNPSRQAEPFIPFPLEESRVSRGLPSHDSSSPVAPRPVLVPPTWAPLPCYPGVGRLEPGQVPGSSSSPATASQPDQGTTKNPPTNHPASPQIRELPHVGGALDQQGTQVKLEYKCEDCDRSFQELCYLKTHLTKVSVYIVYQFRDYSNTGWSYKYCFSPIYRRRLHCSRSR